MVAGWLARLVTRVRTRSDGWAYLPDDQLARSIASPIEAVETCCWSGPRWKYLAEDAAFLTTGDSKVFGPWVRVAWTTLLMYVLSKSNAEAGSYGTSPAAGLSPNVIWVGRS